MELNMLQSIGQRLSYVLNIEQEADISFYAWLVWLWWPLLFVSEEFR